jgi:hypothetical protein
MFGFLTSGAKEITDPLASAKSVASWLRQLPALDVIGRQQHVMRAFDAMRQSRKSDRHARVQAVEFLDAALGADRRQLIKQYVENYDGNPKLAERIWQAIYDLSQGFMYAYQSSLEEALGRRRIRAGSDAAAALRAARALLRHRRQASRVPLRALDSREVDGASPHVLAACELGIERVPAVLHGAGPNATQWTVEQEYLNVLLVHQLNTGNMSPPQLDWAMSQLRAWSRRLSLDAVPRSPEGFFVDIAGKTGLVRRTGNDSGSMLRYLDTTPLAEALERAIGALRQAEATDQGPAAPINQLRIAILEKVSPSVSPNLNSELRRDPRIACAVAAKVRIGLSRICQELGQRGPDAEAANEPMHGSEQIEVYAVDDGSRARRRVPDEHDSLAASLSSFSDPMWQVKDRSVAGLRIAASGGIGQALSLGGLVAVRQSDLSDWVLGVVRRLNKVSNDEVEAGMSIIADRVVPVTLHAVRQAKDDMGFVVDGIDVSTMGARFLGLYLPPPSRPDKPLAVKTLIVPTQEYSEGRSVILTTGRSVYTVALRHLVEQRADWSWAAIQIIEKKSRV